MDLSCGGAILAFSIDEFGASNDLGVEKALPPSVRHHDRDVHMEQDMTCETAE